VIPLRCYEDYKICVTRQRRKEDVLGSPNLDSFVERAIGGGENKEK
jgi:hypothetical protein